MPETKVQDMSGTKFVVVLVLGIVIASLTIAGITKAWNNRTITA